MGRRPAIALVLLLSAVQAVSAQPFIVCRSTEPASVSASNVAVTSAAPFDDLTGLLVDGRSYYYLVLGRKGQPLDISVHRNTSLDTVRLGFDDDGGPVAVDPVASEVTVSPAAIPADGVTTSRVRIVPRDSTGTPLGAGLDVSIDLAALWPGNVNGPLLDRGNGSYELQVSSASPGSGAVWGTVEGIPLNDEPVVTFELAPDTLDLRDLGILALEASIGTYGVLDVAGEPFTSASESVRSALDLLILADYTRDGTALDELRQAVQHLELSAEVPGVLETIDRLLDAGRKLAQFHLDEAEAICGVCDGEIAGPKWICDATDTLWEGDLRRQPPQPDFKGAARKYARAVDLSRQALVHCK